jgi:hypothetical protein
VEQEEGTQVPLRPQLTTYDSSSSAGVNLWNFKGERENTLSIF